jgi:protein required for attachment to host cells
MGPQNWFVVVNRSSAKIFEVSRKPDSLTWLKTIRNPLGTTKNKLMTTDKPGVSRGKYSKAKGLHTLTRERDPHEDVAIEFAKKIAHYLKDHQLEKDYLGLTIAAEPHMMGLVKKAIVHDRIKINVKWVRKDLEKMTTDKLEAMLFKGTKAS